MPITDMRAQQTSHSIRAATAVERISRSGPAVFSIHAQGFVPASPQQAWRVLTDYEDLPAFVPHLRASTLVSRQGDALLLAQESHAGFLFVSQTIRMQLRIIEEPHTAIRVSRVSGDLRHYEAQWKLAPAIEGGIEGTRITYTGQMEPDFFIPPLVGESLVRKDVEQMVEAVLGEIARRSRLQ